MARIKGLSVTLKTYEQTGVDEFNEPVYTETVATVDNCLVGQPSEEEINNSVSMYGKAIEYMLAIPKGDTHNWVDAVVEWLDACGITHVCRTVGFPITGIEENIHPVMPWHMKVRLVSYEQSAD